MVGSAGNTLDGKVGKLGRMTSSSGTGAASSPSATAPKLGGGNMTLEMPWITPLLAMISGITTRAQVPPSASLQVHL